MLVPSAMEVESAIDSMKGDYIPDWMVADQEKEFRSAVPAANDDMVKGYQIGLATARVVLVTAGILASKGVNPKDLL